MKQAGHAEIPIDQLLPRMGSLYKLVVVASRRAQELAEGAPTLIADPTNKPTITALIEVLRGKVSYRVKEGEQS